jgi:DNA-binding transcriptional ArsR family regulator
MTTDGVATAAGAGGVPGATAAAGDAVTAGRAAEPDLLRITDPRMLRALAHPARIAILEHLALDGPATATQCADVAGLSPSACSYHLRALARFGFIEPAPDGAADGRHRPWQTRVLGIDYGDPGSSGAMLAAEHTLTGIVQQRLDEVKDRYHAREAEYPPDWREAAGMRSDVLHVSPAELAEIRDRLAAELSRFRRLDPVDRPPGALRVQVVLDLVPWFGPEDAK